MHVEENSRMKRKHYIERIKMNKVSLSVIMTVLVVLTVLLTSGIAMSAFLGYYKAAVEQRAVCSSGTEYGDGLYTGYERYHGNDS